MRRLHQIGMVIPLLLALTWLLSAYALADWQDDGVPICSADHSQRYPDIASDGASGAIIVWHDYRTWEHYDIYAQRIDEDGNELWVSDGVPICTASNDQMYPSIISDEAGGAIIAWEDYRSGAYRNVYAQRIDSNGNPLWSSDGMPICTALNEQLTVELAPDGAGGAIITWSDIRGGVFADIYAQRVDSDGNTLWTADGECMCGAGWDQWTPQIVPDALGGAIITWHDNRSDGINSDIYCQRVDAGGARRWGTNGKAICTAPAKQTVAGIAFDGEYAAFIAWYDSRNGSDYDIYAQRVDTLGTVSWPSDGVAICTATGNQRRPRVATDGGRGAIITWEDSRADTADLYAQRVDSLGTVLWTADGVALCSVAGDQTQPEIISDGTGGAIVAWHDRRSGPNFADYDIYAQRVDGSGNVSWASNGTAICTALEHQLHPVLMSDGANGAVLAWYDGRAGNSDIYAHRVAADGTTDLVFASASAIGTGGYVTLWWQMAVEVPSSCFLIKRSEPADEEFLDLNVPISKDPGLSFSCTDYSVIPGRTYWYKIILESVSGRDEYGPIEVYVSPVPATYALQQSFPNPLNPLCTIRYHMPRAGKVTLCIFDITGSLVRTLVDARREPGSYSESWDGRAGDGSELPSGVYFYRLKAGEFASTRKMVLLR